VINGLFDALAQQEYLKLSSSETLNIVLRRFELRKLLPLLLGSEFFALALGKVVHGWCPFYLPSVKAEISMQSNDSDPPIFVRLCYIGLGLRDGFE
jgi:hypothetical protein